MVRFKNRYVTAEIEVDKWSKDNEIEEQDVYTCITNTIEKIYGRHGLISVKEGLKVKYCNNSTGIVVVRARHEHYHLLTSTMPLIKKIGSVESHFNIFYIGATLTHCYQEILNHQEGKIAKVLPLLTDQAKAAEVVEQMMDVDAIFDINKGMDKT